MSRYSWLLCRRPNRKRWHLCMKCSNRLNKEWDTYGRVACTARPSTRVKTLALFMSRIFFTDNVQLSSPFHHLTVLAKASYSRFNFHIEWRETSVCIDRKQWQGGLVRPNVLAQYLRLVSFPSDMLTIDGFHTIENFWKLETNLLRSDIRLEVCTTFYKAFLHSNSFFILMMWRITQ